MWEASDDRMKNYVKQQKICQTLSKIYPRMKWGRKRELLPDSEIEVKRKKRNALISSLLLPEDVEFGIVVSVDYRDNLCIASN